jgi:hypothetical protein
MSALPIFVMPDSHQPLRVDIVSAPSPVSSSTGTQLNSSLSQSFRLFALRLQQRLVHVVRAKAEMLVQERRHRESRDTMSFST